MILKSWKNSHRKFFFPGNYRRSKNMSEESNFESPVNVFQKFYSSIYQRLDLSISELINVTNLITIRPVCFCCLCGCEDERFCPLWDCFSVSTDGLCGEKCSLESGNTFNLLYEIFRMAECENRVFIGVRPVLHHTLTFWINPCVQFMLKKYLVFRTNFWALISWQSWNWNI